MSREPKFRGTFGLSAQPIAGLTVYQERKPSEPTFDEMLEELDRSDIREARKGELLARIKDRITSLTGGKKEEKAASDNPKRYVVDAETGKIDVVDDGEYTYKDALLVSGSIKAKGSQFETAIELLKAAKEFTEGSKNPEGEKPREFYVDDDGIIHRDVEAGELTLSEARAIAQSRRPPSEPTPGSYVDEDGNVQKLESGQPIVVKKVVKEPARTYVINPETAQLEEQEAGKPIIIKVQPAGEPPTSLVPLLDSSGQPIRDKEGKTMFTSLEWQKFLTQEKRADEEHKNKMEMAAVFKDFLIKMGNAATRMGSR